jgi:glyoxylase-like metal-dependent hydrolase (beta-lactamase superfamily II)
VKVAAGPWFERRRVGSDIWHLAETYVDPFVRCNVWLVTGRDRALLVDTGLGVVSLREAARDLFERPVRAVATHYHFDHTGSFHEFDERLAHRLAAPLLESSQTIGGALRRTGFDEITWQSFLDAGYVIDDELLDALPFEGFDVDAYAVTACPPTGVLDDGDVVDLGDRAFEVLHLPGHSPDSIGLFDRASGVLFSGDAVYDGPLLDAAPDANVADYVNTMERLRALPVTVVHGGHEASFGRERLVELCDEYLDRAQGRDPSTSR